MSEAGDLWLQNLYNNPDRLPPAPRDKKILDLTQQRISEVHQCMFCGELAERAFVATLYSDTTMTKPVDSRFVDLCNSCTAWIVDGDPDDDE